MVKNVHNQLFQEECHHSYNKKCHTSYSMEYESQQEEECNDNYKKAQNVTVRVCVTPLVKVGIGYINIQAKDLVPWVA